MEDMFGDDEAFAAFDLDSAIFSVSKQKAAKGQALAEKTNQQSSTGWNKKKPAAGSSGSEQAAAKEGLNVDQWRAVHSNFDRPLLIRAGAGSGLSSLAHQ